MSARSAVLRAIFTGACFMPFAAVAGPPYVTDDPEPVEYRHLELYLATQGGYDRDRNLPFTAPHVEVNYGVVPDLQLHLIAPLQYARPDGGAAAYGFGDMEFGAKYRFVHEGEAVKPFLMLGRSPRRAADGGQRAGPRRRKGEPGETRFNVGVVIDVTDLHHILASAGRSLDAGAPAFQWYLAYQLTIGPREPARGREAFSGQQDPPRFPLGS